MTKLAVYSQPDLSKSPENTVHLALTKHPDGYVMLSAVNERGAHQACGNLMRFYPDGTYQKETFGEIDGKNFRSKS